MPKSARASYATCVPSSDDRDEGMGHIGEILGGGKELRQTNGSRWIGLFAKAITPAYAATRRFCRFPASFAVLGFGKEILDRVDEGAGALAEQVIGDPLTEGFGFFGRAGKGRFEAGLSIHAQNGGSEEEMIRFKVAIDPDGRVAARA